MCGAWVGDSKAEACVLQFLTIFFACLNIYAVPGGIIQGFSKQISLNAFSNMLFTTISGILVLNKMTHMIIYQKELKRLLWDLEFGFCAKHSISNFEQKHIYEAERNIMKISTPYIWITVGGASALNTLPLVEKIFSYYNLITPSQHGHYPLAVYIPFNDSSLPAYSVLYASVAMTNYSMCIIWIGADILFLSLILHACGHFKILSDRFRNLGFSKGVPDPQPFQYKLLIGDEGAEIFSRAEKILAEDLCGMITYHTDILALLATVERVYNRQILNLLLTVMLTICSTGFQVATGSVNNVGHLITMTLLLLDMITTCFINCYFGSHIQLVNNGLVQAVYASNWIDFPATERKKVLFILRRTQMRVNLTVGKFTQATLSIFLDIMKVSYSFIAVMRQANQD